jgi:SAM-dependent methyltransferase
LATSGSQLPDFKFQESAIRYKSRDVQYGAANSTVLTCVPIGAKNVLDVGCGTGALAQLIKRRQSCAITGITSSDREAALARGIMNRVVLADLNLYDFGELGVFDCIICSHVLEHLTNPARVLVTLRRHLAAEAVIIVALPNALFWKQRLEFLIGKFRYTKGGLMDDTHLRFFDWTTALTLLQQSGYRVVERLATGNLPQPLLRSLNSGLAQRIDRLACSLMPGFFGWQFVFTAVSAADFSSQPVSG